MPSLVGATFELRQMFGVRKPQKAPAGAVPPVIKEQDVKDNISNLSTEELTRVKFFLSKLFFCALSTKKPFNPLLGETYELIHQDYKFVSE